MAPASAKSVDSGTRERIVAAAFRALARDGYEATSVKDIAVEAGVAPGLVHYYFDTKDDLVLAAIDVACERFFRERASVAGLGPSDEARHRFAAVKQVMRQLRSFYSLIFDMNARALHDPKVRAAIRAFMERDRADIERITRGVIQEVGRESRVAPEAIAAAIYGGINGAIMQKLIDPNFDFDGAIDALSEMAFALARPEG